MRRFAILIFALIAACGSAEREVVTTSVDVDQDQVAALLAEIDGLSDNALDVDAMLNLAVTTPMDEELQDRYPVTFNGADEEVLFHVWREQVDWVHLYFSSESKSLIAAIEKASAPFARDDDTG